jgi:SAM-dependent methyltransferase
MKWFSGEKSSQSAEAPVKRGTLPAPGMLSEQSPANQSTNVDANAPYFLPKDLSGLNQRDLLHYIFRQMFKGNYLAPVSLGEGSRILDVGTGTGRWAIEMAQAFPKVQVYGLDVQENQGTNAHGHAPQKLPNYYFQMGNVLKRLPFIDGSFDFVHQRLLLSEIPFVQWYAVIRELVRVTRPGGWIELIEYGTVMINRGAATERWFSWWEAEAKLSGLDLAQVANLGLLVQQAGLACLSYAVDLPVGPWGGYPGELLQGSLLALYDNFMGRARQSGITHADLQALRVELPVEWQEKHSQLRIFLFMAENKAGKTGQG